jgi:hypothetical protein
VSDDVEVERIVNAMAHSNIKNLDEFQEVVWEYGGVVARDCDRQISYGNWLTVERIRMRKTDDIAMIVATHHREVIRATFNSERVRDQCFRDVEMRMVSDE